MTDLMKLYQWSYNIAAAALHGAGHQQPMSFYITHNGNALRDRFRKKHKIAFVRKGGGTEITERKQEVDTSLFYKRPYLTW